MFRRSLFSVIIMGKLKVNAGCAISGNGARFSYHRGGAKLLTLFNRKELITTFSMKQQAQIRQKLQANGIVYKCKAINRNSASPLSGSRARTGTLGQDINMAYEYIIYVSKQDYERAKGLVRQI